MYKQIGTLELDYLSPERGNERPRIMTDDDVLWYLRNALHHDANDIHINVGHPIIIEVHGRMKIISKRQLDWTEFEIFADTLRGKSSATTILGEKGQYDGEFSLTDFSGIKRRLRVNMTATKAVRVQKAGSIVIRPLAETPPTIEEIGLDESLVQELYSTDGAVYVIGPTGSGKTTTFGAIIRYAAETGKTYHGHLACYESPPEYDLEALSSKHLLVTQVAIGDHWGLSSFDAGVFNAMRRHPGVMMIGEVRDLETVKAVTESAMTGHPVLGTVHAMEPSVAFQRLISRYPSEAQSAGLNDLIMTTRGIVAQRLIPTVDGKRTAIREWLVFNDRMRSELLEFGSNASAVVRRIKEMVSQEGSTFASQATRLFEQGKITDKVLQSVLGR